MFKINDEVWSPLFNGVGVVTETYKDYKVRVEVRSSKSHYVFLASGSYTLDGQRLLFHEPIDLTQYIPAEIYDEPLRIPQSMKFKANCEVRNKNDEQWTPAMFIREDKNIKSKIDARRNFCAFLEVNERCVYSVWSQCRGI